MNEFEHFDCQRSSNFFSNAFTPRGLISPMNFKINWVSPGIKNGFTTIHCNQPSEPSRTVVRYVRIDCGVTKHYSDVIMDTMVSKITSHTIINSTFYSCSGDRFTNGFFIAIQIRWKFRITLTSILVQWSQQNFVLGTTTLLSWHMQKFVAIWWPATDLRQGEFSIESESRAKKL